MGIEYLNPEGWTEPHVYHYSAVVKAADTIHISGSTSGSSDDPADQFEVAFENIAKKLETAGASWDDVIKMTTYHVGGIHTHLDVFREVKDRYVKAPYPAWTGVGVTDLANPASLVEIDVIAHIGS